MRRLSRRTLYTLSVLSLLTCVSTVAAAVRSYFKTISGDVTPRRNPMHWSVSRGRLTIDNSPAVARDWVVIERDMLALRSVFSSLTPKGCVVRLPAGEAEFAAMRADEMQCNRQMAEQLGLTPTERQRFLATMEAHLDTRIAERRREADAERAEMAAYKADRQRERDAAEVIAAPLRAALDKHLAAAAQPWSRSTQLAYPAAGLLAFSLSPCLFHRPRKSGRCTTCSYDLTGNVSGVCPECGTAVAKATC